MEDNGAARPPSRPPEGGDPACWLDQVCPECGRLSDSEVTDECPFCHTPRDS